MAATNTRDLELQGIGIRVTPAEETAPGVVFPPGTLSENLLYNGSPDIDDLGITGWYIAQGSAGTLSTTTTAIPGMGSKRFNISKPTAGTMVAYACRPFPVTPGQTYIISFIAGADSTSATGRYIRMGYVTNLTSTGQITSASWSFTELAPANSAWDELTQQYSYTWICPQGVKFATLAIYSWTNSPLNLYLDNFTVYSTAAASGVRPGSVFGDSLVSSSVTASQIAANTITASQIAATTITANQLAANSITASKIAVADTTNIMRNPDFAGGSTETIVLGTAGAIVTAGTAGVPADAPTAYVFTRAVPAVNVTDLATSYWIPTSPGETFYFEATVASTADANGTIALQARIANSTLGVNVGLGSSPASLVSPTTTWTKVSGMFTTPSLVSAGNPVAFIRFYIRSNINATPLGSWYITRLIARRSGNAEMIVDGAITAIKIDTDAVTANKILAGSITAIKIDTDAVTADKILAGSVTANKVAANAITASKILVSDVTNFYPDFDLKDENFYSSVSAGTIAFAGGTSNNYGERYLTLAQSGSLETMETGWFPVETSTEYLISAPVHMEGVGTCTCSLYIEFGSVGSGGAVTATRQTLVGTRVNEDVTTRFVITDTSASDEKRARFILSRNGGGTMPARTGAFRMQRKASGSLIVDGAITASKIVAGTITGTEIAANSITTSKLVISDFSNLVPNGSFSSGNPEVPPAVGTVEIVANQWTNWGTNWIIEEKTNTAVAAYANSPTPYFGTVPTASANTGTYAMDWASCKAGDKFYTSLSAAVRSGAGAYTAADFRYIIYWLYSDGTTTSSNFYFAANSLSATWTTLENVVTAPAGAISIRMRVYKDNGAIATNVICFTNAIVRRMASAELLVDGSITANALASNSITAGKISIGAVTASKLQTVDTSNVFGDYDHADSAFYSGVGYNIQASSSSANGLYLITILPDAATRTVNSSWFNVEPSTEYRMDLRVSQATAEAASTATASIEWGSMNSAGVASVLSQSVIASRTNSGATNRQGADLVSPGTARRARLVYVRSGGGIYNAQFGGLVMRRRATAALIVDGSITAGKISVTQLSAIQAELGSAVIGTSGSLRSGQTAYNVGTGWWLGIDGVDPKFSIGNPSGAYMRWTGSALEINNATINTPTTNVTLVGVKTNISKSSYDIKGGGASATASVSYTRAGSGWYDGGSSTVGDGYWIRVKKKSASYSALSSGTLDTWLQLDATRTFSLTVTNAIKTGEYTVEISTSDSGTPLIESGTISMTAESYAGAIP